MKFNEIKINKKLVNKTQEQGLENLTLIQEKCLPEIIKGRDVIGQAETGSGKTLAFCLPILDKIVPGRGVQALVITPTRELCIQVSDVFFNYGKSLEVKTTSVYGGVKIGPQIKNLQDSEIVVGTPGRILDHLMRKTLDLRNIQFLVIDETDKMFEMGFIDDVEKIIGYAPIKRQTLMFSATISNDINRLVNKYLNKPLVVKTQPFVDKNKLKQVYYDIYQQNEKFSILVHLLKNNTPGLAIVFCATRREADDVTRNLKRQGINVSAIHGGMSQNRREQSIDALKNQKTDVLVATDVAARGLDIKNITHIYNYDVPKTPIDYIHRIGRTARAGADGAAITLLTQRDHDNFRRVQSNDELEIQRAEIPDFRKVPFVRGFDQRGKPFRRQQFQQNHQHHRVFNHWINRGIH